jgi:transcriptional regulator with XRE-family HTH domain
MRSEDVWGTVAARVDHARRRRGLSVIAIAREAGLDEGTVRRVLGAEPVRLSSLLMVLDVLEIDWAALLSELAEPALGTSPA